MRHFRMVIVMLILLMAVTGTNDLYAQENITVDTTWVAGEHFPDGDVIISNNATLTIEPNAIVKLDAGALISVANGSALVATEATFTRDAGDVQWQAIDIGGLDMSASRLENCTIEHASGRSVSGAMIEIAWGNPATGSPTISGCTIGGGDATRGIYVLNASPQILNNTISGFSDAAVHLEATETATVTGNTFNNNSVGVHIYYNRYTAPSVTGNTYSGSTAADVRAVGTIYEDVAWNEASGTVYQVAPSTAVFGIVESGRLTISDGIIVEVNPLKSISVRESATLVATGVTFTAADVANQWGRITFNSGDQSGNRLEDCIIEYASGDRTISAMVETGGSVSAADSPVITGCTFGNGDATRGIYVSNASPQILNNTFTGFSDAALHFQVTKTAAVTGNTFNDNSVGVHIIYNRYTAPTVTNNSYSNSTEADVRVNGTIYENVTWNENPGTVYRVVSATAIFGIIDSGRLTISDGIIVKVDPNKSISLGDSAALVATGVRFTAWNTSDQWKGITLNNPDQLGTHLEDCIIEYAKGGTYSAMVEMVRGTLSATSPVIIGCTIGGGNGTAARGIYVSNMSPRILNNTISGFSQYGIHVAGKGAPLVAGNIITDNDIGINLLSTESGLYRVNRIEGNSTYGVSNGASPSYPVADARYNWWGSATGPTFTGNPGGTGDEITTKVDYIPFFGSYVDSEPDGMWDEWEEDLFGDIGTADSTSDWDNDGLLDRDEFLYGSDPKNGDSDGDGVEDGLEARIGSNPLLAGDYTFDSDNDGFSDLREIISGTDRFSATSVPLILADGEPSPSGDGDVDGKELAELIAELGGPAVCPCDYDLDTDDDVDAADVFLFSEDYGRVE